MLRLHNRAARVLLLCLTSTYVSERQTAKTFGGTYLGVKHLALAAQALALIHEIIQLHVSLQNTLDRLVQRNLRLIELFLDLHNAVCLLRILIFHDVFFQRRKLDRVGRRL